MDKIQKDKIKESLLKLGLPETETKVYFAVLSQKEATVKTIADEARLSRGTVYDAIERLKKEGYLSETKDGKRRKIIAENPTNTFYSIIDKQQAEVNKKKDMVEGLLSMVNQFSASEKFKPRVRVYSREKSQAVWDELFNCKDKSYLTISKIEFFINFYGREFLDNLWKRKVKLDFHSRAINEDSPLAREFKKGESERNLDLRLAPKGFEFPTTTVVFGDTLAMFSTSQGENFVVVIESKELTQTYRAYFEMMWKSLEKPSNY